VAALREGRRIGPERVATVLAPLWDRKTSADPQGWRPDSPSFGQCAVTSMLIQDIFGGELLRTTVGGVSHYLNRLPSGQLVDATFSQFGPGAAYDSEPVVRERSYVEGHEATMRRYRLLKDRLDRHQQVKAALVALLG